jgi:hypothetical protein
MGDGGIQYNRIADLVVKVDLKIHWKDLNYHGVSQIEFPSMPCQKKHLQHCTLVCQTANMTFNWIFY